MIMTLDLAGSQWFLQQNLVNFVVKLERLTN